MPAKRAPYEKNSGKELRGRDFPASVAHEIEHGRASEGGAGREHGKSTAILWLGINYMPFSTRHHAIARSTVTAHPPASAATIVLQTERLLIRHMTPEDAAFMLELLNGEAWLRFIGDRNVRTLDDARRYILDGPVEMVERLGFGFYIVALKESGCPIGICGLAKRDFLDDVDIGYGFAPAWWGRGYAYEAASAVLAYAVDELGLKRIVATVRADNAPSIALLGKLGLRFERSITHPDGTRDLQLFSIAFA
jgi:RimJ/RimL family protein N-acetyltransferase